MSCIQLDIFRSLAESEALNSVWSRRTGIIEVTKRRSQQNRIYHDLGHAPCLHTMQGGNQVPLVLVTRRSISMPKRSMNVTSSNTRTSVTSRRLTRRDCRTLNSYSVGFLANRFPSVVGDGGFPTPEVRCFLNSVGSLGKNDHLFFCLKTLKGYSLTIRGERLVQSSIRWMSWGMTCNGRCLTARTSVFRKTGSGCSLSDILEESPGKQYSLSVDKEQQAFSTLKDPIQKTYSRAFVD